MNVQQHFFNYSVFDLGVPTILERHIDERKMYCAAIFFVLRMCTLYRHHRLPVNLFLGSSWTVVMCALVKHQRVFCWMKIMFWTFKIQNVELIYESRLFWLFQNNDWLLFFTWNIFGVWTIGLTKQDICDLIGSEKLWLIDDINVTNLDW